MSGELLDQSSDRHGAHVLWVVLHTAEGPTDEFPSRPDLDAGSAFDLLTFFEGKTDRSCHAIADDDVILDNLVPYDRAAWTLRSGNPYSDNLEMCGLASWSRAEWLAHRPMLNNAAAWVAGRLKARGLANHRLSVAECAAHQLAGYMDHWTYTKATGDGTHWDVGNGFPWDVFGSLVTAHLDGKAAPVAILDATDLANIRKQVDASVNTLAVAAINHATYLLMYGDNADDTKDAGTHPANAQEIRRELLQLTADSAAREAALLAAIKSLAGGGPVDLAAVQDAAAAGAAEALGRVSLVVDPPLATDPAVSAG